MNKLILVACLLMLAFAQVQAEPAQADAKPAKPLTSQQQKMKDCNAEAKGKALKGAERKTFMKVCLSADGAATAAVPVTAPAADTSKKADQKAKMKTCNADAKSKALKGDERKAFMKDCLSAK